MRNLSQLKGTVLLEQSDDLLPGEQLDAWHCFSIPNGDSDLRGRESLLGHGDDKISDGPGSVRNPSRSPSLEGGDS